MIDEGAMSTNYFDASFCETVQDIKKCITVPNLFIKTMCASFAKRPTFNFHDSKVFRQQPYI